MAAELVPISDRELWVVSGLERAYKIPVYCDPYSSDGQTITHYVVRPAMGLLAGPHGELESRLRKHDLAGQKSHWVVEAEVIERGATKARGITPAYYYHWEGSPNPDAPKLDTEEITADTVQAWDFLKFVAKQSALDFSVVKLVWMECQRLAVDWLLNKQKPLRFSYMTIYPIPYRVNWKEIMLAKHPKCAPIFRKPEHERDPLLLKTGFTEDLGSADLLAVDGKRKFFNWTLECVPTPHWLACVREAESTRLGIKGPARYTSYYEGRLKEHFQNILLAFGSWLRQMAVPIGRVGESPVSGRPVLMPSRRGHLLPGKLSRDQSRFMVSDKEISLRPGKHDALEEKAARLLAMPGVLPEDKDVRGPVERADVVESIDASGGAGGLRVLDADQGEAGGGDVLAERPD